MEHEHNPQFDATGFAKRLSEAIWPEKTGAFAERAGVSHGVLNKYLRGASGGPQLDIVAKIAEAAGVSLDWLVWERGDGQPLAGSVIRVPRYDATLAAGAGSWNEGKNRLDDIPFTPAFFQKRIGRPSGAGFAVLEARGDSMEPGISDGDLLLIDEGDSRMSDGIFAFVLDEEARVKRFRKRIDGVTILSDNSVYPPEELPTEALGRITLIGRVRWVGKVL